MGNLLLAIFNVAAREDDILCGCDSAAEDQEGEEGRDASAAYLRLIHRFDNA